MNQRQKTFCEEYIKSGNATEAAKAAGYSARTAYSIGQRLLKNVEVQEYIQKCNDDINATNIAKIEEIRQFWTYNGPRKPDTKIKIIVTPGIIEMARTWS